MSQTNKIRPYYNEFNKKKCQAMALLMADGIIPAGDIDDRPIQEVTANDVKGYTQCHFFAGWGGWAYALGLAGWPDGRPVWTGSCPCQPFSSAGRQKGKADERHLWPVWFGLIRQSRPLVVFGEQVSSAIRHHWWDDVADGMEGEGYTTRAEIRPACSVGAPHKRDRLWFVADHEGDRRNEWEQEHGGRSSRIRPWQAERPADYGSLGDGDSQGPQRRTLLPERPDERSPWSSGVEWLQCADGKQRLVKPGIQLLADGYPNRRLLLHIAGDSIVPQVAAAFIGAYMDSHPC